MILQNIIRPNEDTCTIEEMYWHQNDSTRVYDSYFNMLTLHKWREFTTIQKYELTLKATGKYQIEFFDQNGSLGAKEYEGESIISVPVKESSRNVWFAFTPVSDDAEITDGAWSTPEEPTRDVHLACDICTFKREPYLKHNLKQLREYILENPASPLYGKMDIFVIDNGRTLVKEEVETDSIHLFPNMNAGGTGGFTRGLIEINKRKDEMGLTHMIFMDDDAVLLPDSLVRTFALLSYVNEKWGKAGVSGAMLRMDMRYSQHEYGSKWDGMDPRTRYPGIDLRTRENVIKNEEPDTPDYAPWWFACYPLSETGMDNLPLPIFIHNDDTEYGLRHKQNGFMIMNGICVWSPGFENKRSSTLSYYDVRNIMLTQALYTEDGSLANMKKYCRKRILANALRYRYDDAKLVLLAVQDFCKGPEYLASLNPEKKNGEIMAMGYKMLPVEELTDDATCLKEIADYSDPDNVDDIYDNQIKKNKWLYALSANGWILPAKSDRVYAYPMGIWPYALFRKKKIVLFDPDSHKGIYGEKSWKRLFECLGYYNEICRLLKSDYWNANKAFHDKRSWLTSYECWKKYLELD